MKKSKWSMRADALAHTKIHVCKWALDISEGRADGPISNLDRVMSTAVLLDNEQVSITANSLINKMKWECSYEKCAEYIQKAVAQYLLCPIEWQDRYLLDYVAMLPYMYGLSIEIFFEPYGKVD